MTLDYSSTRHELQDAPLPYRAGWELLIGLLKGGAVLCVDDAGDVVSALAPLCSLVCMLTTRPGAAGVDAARAASSGVQVFSLEQLDDKSADTQRFDGLVLHDPTGAVAARLRGGLPGLLDRLRPRLRNGAFIYVSGPNRFGVPRLAISARARGSRLTGGMLSRMMRREGWSVSGVHPLVVEGNGRLVEVLPAAGYTVQRNTGLWRERLKSVLWGRWFARWCAPAIAVVAWVSKPESSLLESIGSRLEAIGYPVGPWKQYLVLRSGKIIVTFDPRRGTAGNGWVVVATREPLAIARRTREAEVLTELRLCMPAAMSRMLPEALDRFALGGLECFVIGRMSGATADAVIPGLDKLTDAALSFLLDLHRATARETVIDSTNWGARIGWLFEQAIHRNPSVADALERMSKAMRRVMLGRSWVQVVTHGDFKIENVMYDPSTMSLTGVIDWEHALIAGMPYLDLAYLLTYNRMLRGQSWIEAMWDVLNHRAMSDDEQRLEQRYWDGVDVPEQSRGWLRAMAVVHHIGVRWHGLWTDNEAAALSLLLDNASAQLSAMTESRSFTTAT